MPRTEQRVLALLIVLAGLCPPAPAVAADMTRFEAACPSARSFLLQGLPGRTDGDAVLAALCPCLEQGFATYRQPEIDALTADLRTGTSDEAKATYLAYGDLQAKATAVLQACFESDDVKRLVAARP